MLMEGACATLGCWRRPVHEFVACLLSCVVLHAQAAGRSRCAYSAKSKGSRHTTPRPKCARCTALYTLSTNDKDIGAPARPRLDRALRDIDRRSRPISTGPWARVSAFALRSFLFRVFDLGQRLVALRRRAPPHQHLSTTTPIRATPHCHTDSRHSQTPTELRQSSEHTQL